MKIDIRRVNVNCINLMKEKKNAQAPNFSSIMTFSLGVFFVSSCVSILLVLLFSPSFQSQKTQSTKILWCYRMMRKMTNARRHKHINATTTTFAFKNLMNHCDQKKGWMMFDISNVMNTQRKVIIELCKTISPFRFFYLFYFSSKWLFWNRNEMKWKCVQNNSIAILFKWHTYDAGPVRWTS